MIIIRGLLIIFLLERDSVILYLVLVKVIIINYLCKFLDLNNLN